MHQHDAVAERELVPQREQIVALLGVGVAAGPGVLELVGIPHADQVAGDQAAEAGAMRHHIAPEIGRGRVAVLEHDRVAAAVLDIGHALAFDGGEFFRRKACEIMARSILVPATGTRIAN